MSTLIVSALIMFFLDFIYLSSTANFYKNLIKNIQKENFKIKLVPTVFCYIFLIFSLYYFILKNKRSVFDAFILGFCIYGIFELTNNPVVITSKPVVSCDASLMYCCLAFFSFSNSHCMDLVRILSYSFHTFPIPSTFPS